MIHLIKIFFVALFFLSGNISKAETKNGLTLNGNSTVTSLSHQNNTNNDSVLLRIAFLGDAEPKPMPEFPGMLKAVEFINSMANNSGVDFVIGVGDIAHKGTVVQYDGATTVLQKLAVPFYPIMGNEEHNNSVDTYLHYANLWNSKVDATRFVLEFDDVAFVLASPDFGRDFNNDGAMWIVQQMQKLAPKPVILVVHGAQTGVYKEDKRKGVKNRVFKRKVVSQPNLFVMVSGDLHMDMPRVNHSKKIGNVQYLHIPGVERTKIPDETNHTPMIRVMSIYKSGKIMVDTYDVESSEIKPDLHYSF